MFSTGRSIILRARVRRHPTVVRQMKGAIKRNNRTITMRALRLINKRPRDNTLQHLRHQINRLSTMRGVNHVLPVNMRHVPVRVMSNINTIVVTTRHLLNIRQHARSVNRHNVVCARHRQHAHRDSNVHQTVLIATANNRHNRRRCHRARGCPLFRHCHPFVSAQLQCAQHEQTTREQGDHRLPKHPHPVKSIHGRKVPRGMQCPPL